MQPGYDLRIYTMIKALTDTVLPAVDSGNRAAVEQLHLVIGSLKLLRDQIDYAHWFEVADARSIVRLIGQLAAEVDLPAVRTAQGRAVDLLAIAERHDVPLTTIRDANAELRSAIRTIIEDAQASSDASDRRRVQSLVLAHSEAQISRERAFIAATGFDVFPDTLQSIEESLLAAG